MKTKTLVLAIALVLAVAPVYAAPGSPVKTRLSKPGLSVSSRAVSSFGRSARVPSRSIGSASPLSRLGTHSIGGSRISPQAAMGLSSVIGALGGHGGLGGLSGYGLGSPWGLYDRHNPYEEIADAYRDAAIANAVVNALGVLVSASQANRAAAVAPAPAPAPAGHYVTERRLVKEGHYETYSVRVPEAYDERTGEWIEGHDELRRRWVPEVWEETQVWVPATVVVQR